MDIIDYLKNSNSKDVYLSSSVFKELTTPTPSVTLWDYEDVIYISSTKDYNTHVYYYKGTTKICDVYDPDVIIDIYNATAGYIPTDVKINSLIGIFSRQKHSK